MGREKEYDGLMCHECGEQEKFYMDYVEQVVYRKYIDKNSDEINKNEEIINSLGTSDHETFCYECKTSINYFSQEERRKLNYLHRRSDGSWSKTELPINERDKELGKQVIIEEL